jgi:hypothetical protein
VDLDFYRLGQLNLDAATLIWEEQYEADEIGKGLRGLVRAMTEADPAQAEFWLDQLPNTGLRDTALTAFLSELFEKDLNTVKERFTDLDNEGEIWNSIELTKRLSYELSPSEFAPMAERLFELKRGGWKRQNELRSLLQTWGEKDAGALLFWISTKPVTQFEDHVIPQATQSLSNDDPVGFLKGLGADVLQNPAVANTAGEAWLNWLSKEGETGAAMEWFAERGDLLRADNNSRWGRMNWSTEQSRQVLTSLSELPESEFRAKIASVAMEGLTWKEPEMALEFVDQFLSTSREKDSVVSSALRRLLQEGKVDAAKAFALSRESATEKKSAVQNILWELSRTDRETALGIAKETGGELQKEALSIVFRQWAEDEPGKVIDYLRTSGDSVVNGDISMTVFFAIGHASGSAEKLDDALSLPQGEIRDSAIHGLFEGWTRTNAETASRALMDIDPGPVRDRAIAGFVESVGFTDREAAVTWALEIGDAGIRRKQAVQQTRYWLYSEKEKATAWINSTEGIPEDLRKSLQVLIK